MPRSGPTLDPPPVFLYFDPHPVHEKMASHVGAEMVQCETGGPAARIAAGRRHDFGDRPVVLEGGVPLVEGTALKLLGTSGPVVALGADSTYHDLVDPLPNQTRASRAAHRIAQRFVDGTLAVSERIATIAERVTDAPVRIAHPFVEAERYDALGSLSPTVDGSTVLCVGKYREKNGQDLLRTAVEHVDAPITVDFVGPDTERIAESDAVRTHGFVSETRLIDLYDEAALVVFPALAGAFPVTTLEALCAATPVVTTPAVGTATLVRGVHGRLLADPDPAAVAEAIDWFFSLPTADRRTLATTARGYGTGFAEEPGLEAFAYQLRRLLSDIGSHHD
ncbi:MAG: glycosyltransferase family 4 protein [Haloplanus sp.]